MMSYGAKPFRAICRAKSPCLRTGRDRNGRPAAAMLDIKILSHWSGHFGAARRPIEAEHDGI